MPLPLAIALLLFAAPAETGAGSPQVDYEGFAELTGEVSAYRRDRLLTWSAFEAAAKEPGALVLDARSADAYAAGHIRGAVNLPLTDFTDESLARVIGKRDRPILIYCNNNFANDAPPVPMKAARLALNIQTFINLVGYGYRDVRELGDIIDFHDPEVGWVRGSSPTGDPA